MQRWEKIWRDHSLSIVVSLLAVVWLGLYTLAWYYDWKWLYGIAAEWHAGLGSVLVLILATKKYIERGSAESKE